MLPNIKYRKLISYIETQVEVNRLKNKEKDKDKSLEKWGLVLARPFGNLLAAIEDNRVNDIERYVIESGAVLAEIYGYINSKDGKKALNKKEEEKNKDNYISQEIKSAFKPKEFIQDPEAVISGLHLASGRSIQIYANNKSTCNSDQYIAKILNPDGSLRMNVYGASAKAAKTRATYRAFEYPAEADLAKSSIWKWSQVNY